MVPEGEEDAWGESWVARDLNLEGIELLDAQNEADLERADYPAIFMNGGPQRDQLYDNSIANPRLHELVMGADVIIGESAGSMVCAEFRRIYREGKATTTKGLGILKDLIIEAYYTERDRHQFLRDEMVECGDAYGLGIDSLSAAVIEITTFPDEYQTIGSGLVELVRLTELTE